MKRVKHTSPRLDETQEKYWLYQRDTSLFQLELVKLFVR